MASQAFTLARAIVDSMSSCGVSQEDFLSGPIGVTNLPWQLTPLRVSHTLQGMSLYEYLDQPTWVSVEVLYNLWTEALGCMRNSPSMVLTPEGRYRRMSQALPHTQADERALLLSPPDGFPHGVSDYAAITLSMEAAHIMKDNVKLAEFVYDDDNYLAILPDGREIGVKQGLPAVMGDVWDLSVEGMVNELLETGRGAIWEGCDYDIISKTRSLLHEKRWVFNEFEALDWALQAMRVLDARVPLLKAIQSAKTVAHAKALRLSRVREAFEIGKLITISDRARMETIRHLLVPDVLTSGQYTKLIYPYSAVVPALLSEKVLTRIRAALEQLAADEEAKHAN